ncbi:uncharacterized protein LOC113147166 [Cyclospora cayetanensis]|uniref:Uncharacterized protein LOC113147166 n=1 Tax=Cyclospora cayetanensis TaxID=88456 RepID=A0A6P6RZM1_9EIME|nr:uncharacterized protein LOC113147166 [Cyclospora cayetanensis]
MRSHCGAPGIPGDDGSVDLASADFHPPHALAMAELTGAFVIPEEAILGGAHRKLPDEQDRLPEDVASQAMEGSAVCERPFPEVGSVSSPSGASSSPPARQRKREPRSESLSGDSPAPTRRGPQHPSSGVGGASGAPQASLAEARLKAAAGAAASSSRRLRAQERGPQGPLGEAHETNRRVRFWWLRTAQSQSSAAETPHTLPNTPGGPFFPPPLGGPSAAPFFGMNNKCQRLPGSRAALLPKPARISSAVPCSSRKAGAVLERASSERGTGRVTCAYAASRKPPLARRACSTCIKFPRALQLSLPAPLATIPLEGGAALEAAEGAASDSSPSVGATVPQHDATGDVSLQGDPRRSSCVSLNSLSRGSGGAFANRSPLVHPQLSGERERPFLHAREGPPRKDPLAVQGVSLAATRAAAVAKAAAAVAAAAQAEVEAAAAAATWGDTGEYYGAGCSVASAGGHRREQLMLVLRLLLLLPPELQHAVQARLFMLQQRQRHRQPLREPNARWTHRAATTASLPGVSVLSSGPLVEDFSKDDRQEQQVWEVDSTVMSLYMSATLQASAMLQLTPGRHAETRQAVDAAAAAGVRGVDLFASNRVTSSCTCGTAAVGAMPLCPVVAALPVHEQSGLLPREVRPQKSSSKGEDGAADCVCASCGGALQASCCSRWGFAATQHAVSHAFTEVSGSSRRACGPHCGSLEQCLEHGGQARWWECGALQKSACRILHEGTTCGALSPPATAAADARGRCWSGTRIGAHA